MSLDIKTATQDNTATIHVTGEVDVSNASELRDAIDTAQKSGVSALVIDLSEVPYIDSTGIGVLVRGAHLASDASTDFSVVHPQHNVERVLTMLGVSGDLKVSD